MRSVWKGAISFGLVSIPIKLFTATESREIKFNLLHAQCQTPIKYQRICPSCNREVTPEETVRGYEYERDKYVIIRDEDLEKLPLDTLRSVQILDFVDEKEIDPIYYMKSYFLAPAEYGVKPYRLLLETMRETGKVAVAKVVLRTKENLAVLRIYQDCLMLCTMFFPEEVRNPAELPERAPDVQLHPNELKMAKSLVDSLTAGFDPHKYRSDYRQALMELIETKVVEDDITTPERPGDTKVINLMEALKQSIDAAQAERRTAPPPKARRKKASR